MTPNPLPVVAAAALVAAFAFAGPADPTPATAGAGIELSRQGTGFEAAGLARIDQFIERHVADKRLPGAVLLLARRGQVAVLKAFGLADAQSGRPMATDSLFRMASASKIVTSAGLLSLYEEGRVGLGDAVSDYLPELRALNVRLADGSVKPATRRLSVRDLLRHTTGFGYGDDLQQRAAYQDAGLMPKGRDDDWTHDLTLAQWTARLATVLLTSEPGTRFEYGFGTDIAGALIERVSGLELDAFLEARIFGPLRMRDTGFVVRPASRARLTTLYRAGAEGFVVVDPAGSSLFAKRPRAWSGGGGWDMAGHGGVITTAGDYFRFLQMLLNGGELGGTRVLSRHTVDFMLRNQLAPLAAPERAPGVGFGFGYAIVVDAARYGDVGSPGLLWWAGSTNTRYWMDPHEQLIGLYLSQVLPFPYLDLMGSVMRLSYHALE
jgi:CubicO group peptidase (beta-lactamase class C family)